MITHFETVCLSFAVNSYAILTKIHSLVSFCYWHCYRIRKWISTWSPFELACATILTKKNSNLSAEQIHPENPGYSKNIFINLAWNDIWNGLIRRQFCIRNAPFTHLICWMTFSNRVQMHIAHWMIAWVKRIAFTYFSPKKFTSFYYALLKLSAAIFNHLIALNFVKHLPLFCSHFWE